MTNLLRLRIIQFTIACLCCIPYAISQPTSNSAASDGEPNRIRGLIVSFVEDQGTVDRFHSARQSPLRRDRFRKLYNDYLASLRSLPFDALNRDEQIDYILLANDINRQLSDLDREEKRAGEMSGLVPFLSRITGMEESRRRLEDIKPESTAVHLNILQKEIVALHKKLEAEISGSKKSAYKPTVANRAARTVTSLRNTLSDWFSFYKDYDPVATWWIEEPYKSVDGALEGYAKFLRDKLAGVADSTVIIGDPIGREALLNELQFEMIPYSPEELVQIANKEFAWCENEMKKASRELGYGDNWKEALEHVKTLHVPPGRQPALIRDLAWEATEFVETNNLVTVPPMAKESWRMEMMSPERQLFSPFFLGGEQITVSYPTNTMSHEQKMMSMRGNNRHFSHATVQHELIPGHYLQQYMLARYHPYRSQFYTPFWMEGWALYWEFLLWDKNFHKTPEDRVGALFWRMHRCARIIFSLGFHLETMTTQQCVDFLVERVGHERNNAMAEVRRSFAGDYGPLYQIAYMVGGLQFYQLHHQLVDSGKMSDKAFHDAILHENAIPVELVRAILTNQKLSRDFKTQWKFYEKD